MVLPGINTHVPNQFLFRVSVSKYYIKKTYEYLRVLNSLIHICRN